MFSYVGACYFVRRAGLTTLANMGHQVTNVHNITGFHANNASTIRAPLSRSYTGAWCKHLFWRKAFHSLISMLPSRKSMYRSKVQPSRGSVTVSVCNVRRNCRMLAITAKAVFLASPGPTTFFAIANLDSAQMTTTGAQLVHFPINQTQKSHHGFPL